MPKLEQRNPFKRDTVLRDQRPGEDLEGARLLPLEQIVPNEAQFRQSFNEETIRELADSIAEQGLIEPLVVRPAGERFEVVAGERRRRALVLLAEEGHEKALAAVPVLIRTMDDQAAALTIASENLQREDFTIADEAVMYERLISVLGLDPERGGRELARRLGLDRSRVNRVRQVARYPSYMAAIEAGTLTLNSALIAIKDIEENPNYELAQIAPSSTEIESSSPLSIEEIRELTPPEQRHLAPAQMSPQDEFLLHAEPFSTRHVAAHERRVPAAGLKPWVSARTQFIKWGKQRDEVLDTLPVTELDLLEREAEEVRQQAEETLAAIRQRRAKH